MLFKKSVYGELVKKVNSIHAFDTSELVTKTDSDTKIKDIEKKKSSIHDKHVTTSEFNQFSGTLHDNRCKTRNEISDFIAKTYLNEKLKNINIKVTLNKTKHLEVEKKLIDQSKIFSPISEKRLYVLIMSRMSFRVNPHSIVALMSRNSLLETGAKYEVQVTATGLEPTTT